MGPLGMIGCPMCWGSRRIDFTISASMTSSRLFWESCATTQLSFVQPATAFPTLPLGKKVTEALRG